MKLLKLENSFYQENKGIIQALDCDATTGEWTADKTRGHGIVQIQVNGLTFAIPVRSCIKHDASFILEVDRQNHSVKGMGLDYTKALLLRKLSYVSNDVFVLRGKHAGKKLVGKEHHVTKQFTQYVEKYIESVKKGDKFVLNSMEYRFTTLVNYHPELGLT
jgi:protein AbiQ